jgi:cupin fold WbuC family metalloprotein
MNVHKQLDAAVQRLFIATEPDTYMRPHRHPQSHKWEFFVLLKGRIDLLVFDSDGQLASRVPMSSEQTLAVEVPPNTWHCYVCMQPGTLALEVKEGAYIPTAEVDFAPWSPAEGSVDAPAFVEHLRDLKPA